MASAPRLDQVLAERLRQLIALPPTFGYRRLGALLRFAPGLKINRKAVYRVLRRKGWFVHPPPVTPRPRVHGLKRRAQRSAERWAMEVTHVPCGVDGGGHLTAVIDRHDCEVTGVEFALRGRAKQAERALEEACLARFGTEQNGIVARFFRSRQEEGVWPYNFGNFAEARTAITPSINWYNAGRPHQALGYRSPRQFRALQPQLVA